MKTRKIPLIKYLLSLLLRKLPTLLISYYIRRAKELQIRGKLAFLCGQAAQNHARMEAEKVASILSFFTVSRQYASAIFAEKERPPWKF